MTCRIALESVSRNGGRGRMSNWERFKQQIVESQVWRSIFRHGYEDTPRNRILAVVGKRLAAPAPVEGPQARRPAAVHLVHGRHHVPAVPDHGRHRRLPDVLLPADGGVRLRRHEVSRVRRALRHAHAQHAPLGGARDGDRGLAAHVPGVHDRLATSRRASSTGSSA